MGKGDGLLSLMIKDYEPSPQKAQVQNMHFSTFFLFFIYHRFIIVNSYRIRNWLPALNKQVTRLLPA